MLNIPYYIYSTTIFVVVLESVIKLCVSQKSQDQMENKLLQNDLYLHIILIIVVIVTLRVYQFPNKTLRDSATLIFSCDIGTGQTLNKYF